MTTLTPATSQAIPRAEVATASAPAETTRRTRIGAAAFGALAYFGLSFAQALVVPASVMGLGQLAALVLGMAMAGRLVRARDRHSWLRVIWSVIVAIVVIGVGLWAIIALLIWGPLAP